MDYFDLTQPTGSLAASFAASTDIKYLVVSFTSDWLYPSYHSKKLVSALTAAGADVTYLDVKSSWGHDAFLLEVETMTHLLTSFLDRLVQEEDIAMPAGYQPLPRLHTNGATAPPAAAKRPPSWLRRWLPVHDTAYHPAHFDLPIITSTDSHGQTAVAAALRPDLGAIADLVTPGTRVLDLGCGDGALLEHLVRWRQVKGRGIELSEQGVLACVVAG